MIKLRGPRLLLILIAALCASKALGLDAPNERVGYRACVHLVLRLVDCLIDACDLYLAKSVANLEPLANDDLVGNKIIGAIGPFAADKPQEIGGGDGQRATKTFEPWFYDAEKLASTKPMQPMSRTTPVRKLASSSSVSPRSKGAESINTVISTTAKTTTSALAGGQDLPDKQTSGCWHKALEWLRDQLLEMRMRLLSKSSISLSEVLQKFEQFDEYLAGVCGNNNQANDLNRPATSLDYVLETVQVMAEIHEEAERKAQRAQKRRGSKGKEDNKRLASADFSGDKDDNDNDDDEVKKLNEKKATEAIKLHYAYLTQIITSYNLLFNALDRDLMQNSGKLDIDETIGVPLLIK